MMPSRLSLDMAHGRQADLRRDRADDARSTVAQARTGTRQQVRGWRLVAASRHQLRPA